MEQGRAGGDGGYKSETVDDAMPVGVFDACPYLQRVQQLQRVVAQ